MALIPCYECEVKASFYSYYVAFLFFIYFFLFFFENVVVILKSIYIFVYN